MGSRRWHRSPDGASPNSSPSLPPSPSIAPPSAGRSCFGLPLEQPGEQRMPVVALSNQATSYARPLCNHSKAWCGRTAAAGDRSLDDVFQAEPLKCQRLVGSGRQMANRLAVCIAHFDFLREGERFSPSVSVTLGHQGLLALARAAPGGDLLGVRSPHRACARRGHGKELPRSPTRFDLKEETCMRDPLVS